MIQIGTHPLFKVRVDIIFYHVVTDSFINRIVYQVILFIGIFYKIKKLAGREGWQMGHWL